MINPSNLKAFAGAPKPAAPEDNPMGEGMEGNPEVDRFEKLRPALEEFVDDIEEAANQIDPDMLRNLDMPLVPDDAAILKMTVDELDPRLQGVLIEAAQMQGISMEDGALLGGHLEGEGLTADGDRLGGWLFRVGEAYPMSGDFEEEADLEPLVG